MNFRRFRRMMLIAFLIAVVIQSIMIWGPVDFILPALVTCAFGTLGFVGFEFLSELPDLIGRLGSPEHRANRYFEDIETAEKYSFIFKKIPLIGDCFKNHPIESMIDHIHPDRALDILSRKNSKGETPIDVLVKYKNKDMALKQIQKVVFPRIDKMSNAMPALPYDLIYLIAQYDSLASFAVRKDSQKLIMNAFKQKLPKLKIKDKHFVKALPLPKDISEKKEKNEK